MVQVSPFSLLLLDLLKFGFTTTTIMLLLLSKAAPMNGFLVKTSTTTNWRGGILRIGRTSSFQRYHLQKEQQQQGFISKINLKPVAHRLFTGGTTTTATTKSSSSRRHCCDEFETVEEVSSKNTDLEWETFDFSDSPKWDTRFNPEGKSHNKLFEEMNDKTMEEEARQDVMLANQQREQRETLFGLDPHVVRDAMRILLPYVQPKRYERITQVLQQRTRHTHFLFENPSNPSNVWACLRTMDSFGIQHVHIVTESEKYEGKAALLQKQGMRTAMGSAQWLTIHHYISTKQAVETLRRQTHNNCRIIASDLNPSSIDIRDIDWAKAGSTTSNSSPGDESNNNDDDDDDRPICIVMGNELRGISDTMRDLADMTFTLPMVGFAESFNLSVATAITLAHLSAASSHTTTGPLRPGDLPKDEFNALVLRGMIHSISQRRVTQALLKKEGIILPDSLYQKGINLGKKLKSSE